MGLPSLLSSMASPKSMVYVVFSLSVSFSSTVIRLPPSLISGASNCGGDTITFDCASVSFMNSSKYMAMRFALTWVALSSGAECTTRGGSSSYHPPSGLPMFAQEVKSRSISESLLTKARSWSIYSRVLLSRGTLFCPPNLPRRRIHSLNSPLGALMSSSGCRVMSL